MMPANELQIKVEKSVNAILNASSREDMRLYWDKMHGYKKEIDQLPQFDQKVFSEHMVLLILQPGDSEVLQVAELLIWFSPYILSESNSEIATCNSEDIFKAAVNYMKETKFHDIEQLEEFFEAIHIYLKFLPLNSAFGDRSNCSYIKEICVILVRTLANFTFLKNNKSDVTFIRTNLTKIEFCLKELIKVMGTVNEDVQLITVCLKTLYSIISDPNQKQVPGLAVVVLKLVDNPKKFFTSYFVSQEHDDAHLARALKVLCFNLPCWSDDKISVWIIQLIQVFEERQKYAILNKLAEEILPKIFCTLKMPALRLYCSRVIFYILKRQAVPTLLNKMQQQILETFHSLKNEENAKDCLQNLVDIINGIILRFPNDLILHSFPVSPRSSEVNEILSETIWDEDTKEIMYFRNRLRSSKVGLPNLGNTCYMNSVLQALVMTRQFCHEVLKYCPFNEAGEKGVLKKLQNLFALLMYSERNTCQATDILQACRPAYFIAGQQHDSSEFLCYLLDVLHEQEKSINMQYNNCDPMTGAELKNEERDCEISECEPMESESNIKRWTTEENLSEGAVLQRKTQSLADFTKGDELSQRQNLSDSHSDSTDSGIQSVGGEDTGQVTLVHRVFGGQIDTTYQCVQCNTSSHNTDKFRDLQLCFPEEISENEDVSVQDLINCYLLPEKLTGDNKYRCDKCRKLCDAQRLITIAQAPAHLILTLKHFRYDSETRLRTKLRHKVTYNETIHLEVRSPSGSVAEEYHLYAAVVHAGYNMDYGHYFTYACDEKNNWYKFNDSFVSQTTLSDFKRLEPPCTPYILFYSKAGYADGLYNDKPQLASLSKSVQDLVNEDRASLIRYDYEKKQTVPVCVVCKDVGATRKEDSDDDDNPPSSTCRGPVNLPNRPFLC